MRTRLGQATVELALTLPVLVLIGLGVFDFGRGVWSYNALAEAAREGTRYAMVHGASSDGPVGPGASSFTSPDQDTVVTGIVRSYAFGINPQQVTVLSTWPDADNSAGHRVNVVAQYSYSPLTTLFLPGVAIPLHSAAQAIIVN